MPHFIAECTDNIREQADLPGLFAKVNEALAATGIFPIGGIRSRAHWLDTWQMADGRQDYAFVHMTLKIGAGRSLESRQDVGDMLFARSNPTSRRQWRAAIWRCRSPWKSSTRR